MRIQDLNPIPYWMNTLHRHYHRALSLIEMITWPIFAILNCLRWNRQSDLKDDNKSFTIQESPSPITQVAKKILPDSKSCELEPASPPQSEIDFEDKASPVFSPLPSPPPSPSPRTLTIAPPLSDSSLEDLKIVNLEESKECPQVEEEKSAKREDSASLHNPVVSPPISSPIESIKPQEVEKETETKEEKENHAKLGTFFANLRMIKDFKFAQPVEKAPETTAIKPSLASIEALLSPLEKKVILKVKKVKNANKQINETEKLVIAVKQGKECKIKGDLLKVLENSVNLFSHLSLTQLSHLKNNLLFIKKLLSDEDQTKLMTIMKILYAQQTALWVAHDFEKGKLEEKCIALVSFVLKGIKKGEGRSGAGCERLFRYTSSISDQQMEEWRYNNFAATDKFTVYDWNKFLNQYIKQFPKEKVENFKSFQNVSSVSETIDVMASLPHSDQVLVAAWLRMFKVTLEWIWIKEDLDLPKNKNIKREEIMEGSTKAMLAACPTICRLLAPEQVHATHATINTQFLVEILVKYMDE